MAELPDCGLLSIAFTYHAVTGMDVALMEVKPGTHEGSLALQV